MMRAVACLAFVFMAALAFGADEAALADVSCPTGAPSPALSSPEGFNLAGGVIWKKFRKVKDRYVLGQPAEGSALKLFNTSLRSRNAALAAEARSILDAIALTRDVLGERLEAARREGVPGAEEWIRLYLASYPSRRARFAAGSPGTARKVKR